MNVVFLCGYPFGENRLGVSEHIYQLSKALASAKESISCHIVSMQKETKTTQVSPNIWVHSIERKPYHYLAPFLAATTLKVVVERIQPDIVHLHGASLPYVLTAVGLSKTLPVVVTIHGNAIIEASYKRGLAKIWGAIISGTLMKYAIRNLGTTIVCSQHMKENFARLNKTRVFVIPNGIDLPMYQPSKEKRGDQRFSYVLYMGGYSKVKGVDLLIRSLPLVYRRTGPIPVYIAGPDTENKELIRLVRQEGVEQSVKLLGFVTEERKVTLLQQAGLIVVPSRYESFGIVILEAMACGIPVVASRSGGIVELIQDRESGLLFDAENVTQLADCIATMIQNPKLRELYAHKGLEFAGQYSWPVIAEKTVVLYHDCIDNFMKGKNGKEGRNPKFL